MTLVAERPHVGSRAIPSTPGQGSVCPARTQPFLSRRMGDTSEAGPQESHREGPAAAWVPDRQAALPAEKAASGRADSRTQPTDQLLGAPWASCFCLIGLWKRLHASDPLGALSHPLMTSCAARVAASPVHRV